MKPYDAAYDPPAAVLDVTIVNPFTKGQPRISGRGVIDSGAFKSVIPQTWASQIGLLPITEIVTKSYDGREKKQPASITNIVINDHVFEYVEVLLIKRYTALIGRDILNQLKLTLDGPHLEFEII
jgi:predicted aspartyl protease